MNMSRAISQLKMSLGLYAVALPFKDSNGNLTPTENVIRDVLVTTTIPIFSSFCPWIRRLDTNINSLRVINKQAAIYELPKALTEPSILYVVDVTFPTHSGRGDVYGDIMVSGFSTTYGGITRGAQDVATATASSWLASQMKAEPTWEYLDNNKIKLYGFPRTVLTFITASEHEPNGETIPASYYEAFMQLAVLDVKMFLYNTLKLYDGMSSAFGNVSLKIDEYQSADADRTSLLKEWTEVFHLDQIDLVQWM